MSLSIENKHEGCITFVSENRTSSYAARFDGCVHIHKYYNDATVDSKGADVDVDYIHICELEQFIATLQEVVVKAREHFGPKWPVECNNV